MSGVDWGRGYSKKGEAQVLFRTVEVRLNEKGRLEKVGPVWHPTMERARSMALRLVKGPLVIRVEIQAGDGKVLESFQL